MFAFKTIASPTPEKFYSCPPELQILEDYIIKLGDLNKMTQEYSLM